MFRVGAVLLSMIGFVAGQWAAMPHAHGGASAADQRRHDATPHFHLGGSGHHHDGGHTHAGEHHSNHELGWSDSSPSAAEHDVTAIFVVASASKRLIHGDEAASCPFLSKVLSKSLLKTPTVDSFAPLSALSSADGAAFRWRDPEPSVDGSGRYLTLRTLRI